jgi:hypothetical protein
MTPHFDSFLSRWNRSRLSLFFLSLHPSRPLPVAFMPPPIDTESLCNAINEVCENFGDFGKKKDLQDEYPQLVKFRQLGLLDKGLIAAWGSKRGGRTLKILLYNFVGSSIFSFFRHTPFGTDPLPLPRTGIEPSQTFSRAVKKEPWWKDNSLDNGVENAYTRIINNPKKPSTDTAQNRQLIPLISERLIQVRLSLSVLYDLISGTHLLSYISPRLYRPRSLTTTQTGAQTSLRTTSTTPSSISMC